MNLTLAWLNLLGDVRQLPFLGIYVIMFFDILKTFMQFGLVFVIFIVAFGLGFHLLLINQVCTYIHTFLLHTVRTVNDVTEERLPLEASWKPPGSPLEAPWKPPGSPLDAPWKTPGRPLEVLIFNDWGSFEKRPGA